MDHYVPATAGGDDSDDNLIYACFRCNLFKGEFHPTDVDRANGRFVLHPLRDDTAEHWRLAEQTGRLEPLTEIGRFHIALLHLNRQALVAYRLRNRYQQLLARTKDLVEAENAELRALIQAQEKYIARLRNLVGGDLGAP